MRIKQLINKDVIKDIQWALISRFGFLLDTHTENTAELQFIHSSGMAIIRWHSGDSNSLELTWVPNNLRIRDGDTEQQEMARKQSIQLFKDFRRFFHETIDRQYLRTE